MHVSLPKRPLNQFQPVSKKKATDTKSLLTQYIYSMNRLLNWSDQTCLESRVPKSNICRNKNALKLCCSSQNFQNYIKSKHFHDKWNDVKFGFGVKLLNLMACVVSQNEDDEILVVDIWVLGTRICFFLSFGENHCHQVTYS